MRVEYFNDLYFLRTERKLTQQQLADKVGVSQNTISDIESGKYVPSLKNAYHIAYVLEVDITDVFWYFPFN